MFPSHTLFNHVAMGVSTGVILWSFAVVAVGRAELHNERAWRWGITTYLAAVYAYAVYPSLLGAYADPAAFVPTVSPRLAVILLPGALLLFWSPYRRLVRALPLHWLIGAHALRVVPGLVIVFMGDTGQLPLTFALGAGYGDILSGALAVPVAFMVQAGRPAARRAAAAWNAFGLLDLGFALSASALTFPAWFAALAAQGVSTDFVSVAATLPVFPVPLWIVVHLLIFFKLSRSSSVAARTTSEPSQSVHPAG